MARKVRDARLESRTSRQPLGIRNAPYWMRISAGLAIGYRKGKRGGSWLGKLYDKDTGKRIQDKLAIADDILDANGTDILSFDQAQEKARGWREEKRRLLDGFVEEQDGPYTVEQAMNDYLANYETEGGKSLDRMLANINAHILPALGRVEVTKLKKQRINEWHRSLAETPARLRTRTGNEQRYRDKPSDPEAFRKRKCTANKILTILKAALNHALREERVIDNSAWVSVKPFKDVEAANVRYLTDAESIRLVNACPPDLRAVVTAALLSGARYGELAALRVSDFDSEAGTLYIAVSKGGKPRHIVLTEEGQKFLSRNVLGKAGDDFIFRRASGTLWGRAHQYRPLKEACGAANIVPVVGFHILRHTYASRLAMRSVPMAVIAAQLGHADTRVTEKHYAHLGPSYVADTVRNAFDEIGLLEDENIVNLQTR